MGGHDEEFATFAREASPRLLRTAYYVSGNATDAQDLVQGALVKTYLKWKRVRHDNPAAYARRCLINLHIDTWRSRRHETVSDPAVEAANLSVDDREPEDTSDLVALLQILPRRERQAVVLRHYVGLSEAQTAESLGVSVGTVKSSTSRGLARLRAHLSHTEETSHA